MKVNSKPMFPSNKNFPSDSPETNKQTINKILCTSNCKKEFFIIFIFYPQAIPVPAAAALKPMTAAPIANPSDAAVNVSIPTKAETNTTTAMLYSKSSPPFSELFIC